MTRVKDIYDYINEIAPFCLQESYDNSGMCIGSEDYSVDKVLLALDCTSETAKEAFKKGCQLIVTHHPVIFHALKKIDLNSVVGFLAASKISVISAHTNFDSAKMNDILCEKLGLTPCEPLAVENGVPVGYICETEKKFTSKEIAANAKEKLGCKVVRYNDTGKSINRIAVCSGSGGSFLQNALEKKCGGFITGDVKHDVFIDAYNAGLCVFDAGHFHTEIIFCGYMQKALSEKFPDVEFIIGDNSVDILSYEI